MAASYSIIPSGTAVQVKDLAATVNGNDATDTVQNVEVLKFLDAEIEISSMGNRAPVAVADTLTVSEDAGATTVAVLANDSDPDSGDTLTVISVGSIGRPGSISIAPGGREVVYSVGQAFQSLLAGESVTESFTYTIADSRGAQATSSVTVTITGSNDGPIALSDIGQASEDGPSIVVNVLANDVDPDAGDAKSVVSISATGLQGTASVAAGGTGIVYSVGNAFQQLRAGATATETFSYVMRDAAGATSTASVTITVSGTNDIPVAVANTAVTSEDGVPITIDVLGNDSDVDVGDTKRVVSVTDSGLQGTVSITPGGTSVVYAVGSAFQTLKAGAITTKSFSYTMADTAGAQSSASVTVTVTGVNDNPVATADAVTVSEDAAATTIAVLANDTDIDTGDTKRVLSVNSSGLLGSATVATNGTSIVYSVGSAFQHLLTGQTATETFSYTMADASGAQSTATVTVTINGATDGPKAVNDTASAHEDGGPIVISVLSNDFSDVHPGDYLTITSIDGAGQFGGITLIIIYGVGVGQFFPGFPRMLGQATISPDGRSIIIYTPMQSLNAGEVGVDMFKYTITGTGGGTSTGIVTVTVTGANDAPVAANDSATHASDAPPITINVLANDTDPDTRIDPPLPPGDEFGPFDATPVDVPDTKTVVAVDSTGLQGSVAIAAGGGGVVYSVGGSLVNLAFGASVVETFTYTMRDSAGAQSTASVSVTVTGTNHAPTALDDTAAAVEDGAPVTIDVLANDTDSDIAVGDSLTLVSASGTGLQGTVAVVGSRVVYTVGGAFQSLKAGAIATELINYTIADSRGKQTSAKVTVTVTGTNDAPVAVANSVSVSEDASPTTITVLANDTDVDAGDTKQVVLVSAAGLQGSVAVVPGGTGVVYTVGASFQSLLSGQTATETFSYTMVDSFGAQATATVSVVIVGANEPVVYVTPPPPPPGAILGTTGDDVIVTGAAADIIYGLAGDDDISSGGGAGVIFGEAGRDALDGGDGNDILIGGSDGDDLTGGKGADVFRYYLASESTTARPDKIDDFDASEGDKIDLNLIDANTVLGGNNDFVLRSRFTGTAGELIVTAGTSGVYWVKADVNGDGVADLEIEVRSDSALGIQDFQFEQLKVFRLAEF